MVKQTAGSESTAGMPPFTGETKWETWEYQLKLLIVDKGFIAEKKKVNFLLKSLGLETLDKVIDWCSPDDPQDVGYDALLALLRSKFVIKKNKFALRLGILNEKQNVDESAREYFAKMTQRFGQCELEKMKPDEYGVLVLLRGLASDEMRDFLMNPANDISTVDKLEQLAVAFEDSRKASRDIKAVGKDVVKPMSINVVGKGVPVCAGCGKQHGKGRCAAKDVECWVCEKIGHFARFCKSRKSNEKHRQNQVSEEEDDSAEENDHRKVNCLNGIYPGYDGVLSVTSGSDGLHPPAFLRVKVNDARLKFQHDTGSGVSLISKSVWVKLGKPKIRPCENLRSYNGVIETLGKCLIEAKLGEECRKLWVTVVERGKCILGRDWMLYLNVRSTFNELQYHQNLREHGQKQRAVAQSQRAINRHAELKRSSQFDKYSSMGLAR